MRPRAKDLQGSFVAMDPVNGVFYVNAQNTTRVRFCLNTTTRILYRQIQTEAGGDEAIKLFTNLTGVGNIEVNAIQRDVAVRVRAAGLERQQADLGGYGCTRPLA